MCFVTWLDSIIQHNYKDSLHTTIVNVRVQMGDVPTTFYESLSLSFCIGDAPPLYIAT
jgi:hypothetical protein